MQLVFDPQIPEFTIVDANSESELCTSLFHSVPDVDPKMLSSQLREYALQGYHPVSNEATAFLKGFINRLSSHGTFIGKRRPAAANEYPCIGRASVLFLRARTKGFGTAIEQVIQTIESRQDFCQALLNIVGCEGLVDAGLYEDPSNGMSRELPQRDVLFGKEANPEQLRIARQLTYHEAVLVQGPPGTGKSHTIANLIGHLLAQGKSVLVTSHTTKALRVLRSHVVEELRPLCVSVLDSDLESQRQLEQSVHAISSRLSESDADDLHQEAELLARRRAQLVDELHRCQTELLNAREAEYREIVVGGQAYSPPDAARLVAAGKNVHDWIPASVAPGEPLPFSAAEVRELYSTNGTTLPEDEHYLDAPLPELGELPSPDAIAELTQQSEQLASQGSYDERFWPKTGFTSRHIGDLRNLAEEFREAVDDFKRLSGWHIAAVDAGRSLDAINGPWHHLLGKIDEAISLADEARLQLARYRPVAFDGQRLEMQAAVASEIQTHLLAGGKLRWLDLVGRPTWRQSLGSWRVHGNRSPSTAEEVSAVLSMLRIRIARTGLSMLWGSLMTPHGAPDVVQLGDEPEQAASQFAAIIRDCLEWWTKRWLPLVDRLKGFGFEWERFLGEQSPNLGQYGYIYRTIDCVESRLVSELERTASSLHSTYLKRQIHGVLDKLKNYDRPEIVELRQALGQFDLAAYRSTYNRALAAAQRRTDALRRKELLARLERRTAFGVAVAETWAQKLRYRNGFHGVAEPPGDAILAWQWRQLNDELDRRSEVNLEQLGQKIDALICEIKRTTIQLIDRRAWTEQVRRTSLHQRQALMGWLGIVNRIGKGFGKRVPQLRREAQKKMEECRDAVPVWIMPLTRLVESFDFREPRFDVVIIDEASQCDIMALLAQGQRALWDVLAR